MEFKNASKVLIFNQAGNVLLLRRSDTHPHVPLSYDIPGGELEANETMQQALVREVFEEAGIMLEPSKLEKVGKARLKAFGKEYDVELYVTYLEEETEVILSWEHDLFEWRRPQEVSIVGTGFETMVEKFLKSNTS